MTILRRARRLSLISAKFFGALLSAFTVVACSGQSPVTPSPSAAVAGDLSAKPSPAVPGVYDLSFNVYRNGDVRRSLEPGREQPGVAPEGICRRQPGASSAEGQRDVRVPLVQGRAPERHRARGRSPKGSMRAGIGNVGAPDVDLGQRWTLSTASAPVTRA